jgi:hypothetical protein
MEGTTLSDPGWMYLRMSNLRWAVVRGQGDPRAIIVFRSGLDVTPNAAISEEMRAGGREAASRPVTDDERVAMVRFTLRMSASLWVHDEQYPCHLARNIARRTRRGSREWTSSRRSIA